MPQSIEHIMAQEVGLALASPFTRDPLKSPAQILPAMPLEIVYKARPVIINVQFSEEDAQFTINDEEPDATKWQRTNLDAYKLREVFLGVRTKSELLELLLNAGGFRGRPLDQDFPSRAPRQDSLLWSHFRDWQGAVRAIMSNGPLPIDIWDYEGSTHWVDHITDDQSVAIYLRTLASGERLSSVHPINLIIGPSEESLEGSRRGLRAEIHVNSMLEAVLATTFLDGLSGIAYRLCSLVDCDNIYEVNSRHERHYCSQPCAHKASVRRRRAEAKLIKSSKKSKTSAQPKRG